MADADEETFLEPFRSLVNNPVFGQGIDLIEIAGRDDEERALMTELGLAMDGVPAAVLLVPPGYVTAQWRGSANADDIFLRVLQASARCFPGGGCCS
jgi:hypothetical protein